ncbi:MAG: histidine kinase [Burkholderiales bacterium]|nr:histidine kinase [Burkholderiales bacterium]
MINQIIFIVRTAVAWLLTALLVLGAVFEIILGHPPHGMEIIPLALGFFALIAAFSHIRRVRLISQEINPSLLSNRQRRQTEIPLDVNEAFALIEAAIRELPNVERVDSAPDSLQLRAKLKRIHPYHSDFLSETKLFDWLQSGNNQILVTVTPGLEACSATIICEPDRAAWTDFYLVDNGTNLENSEALGRAISRRIAQTRQREKAATQQTMTEKELTVAKLNLLHAQVEPHFLYNTLASAQLLTRSDPAKADDMLGNLITYLRNSLPRTEDSLSSIGAELERSRAYLDIMKIRMGSRLQVHIEVPDYLLPVLFPSMMLQTLIENAIKHGLEPKSGGGTVWILARAHENTVAVTVADDGRGFSAEGGGTGIGLRNVRERLRLAYGTSAHFNIVANFPSGVAATITVPTSFLQGEHHA